jgi:DNA-binding transcriptional ArsR family regulator
MPTDDRRVVLDGGSSETRRRLGATAWMVFEELLLASVDVDGECTATTSVRALAARTGLAKDTVARALSRLRRAGLITAQQARNAGAFAAGSYRVVVPCGISVDERLVAAGEPVDVVARPGGFSRLSGVVQLAQLSLLAES